VTLLIHFKEAILVLLCQVLGHFFDKNRIRQELRARRSHFRVLLQTIFNDLIQVARENGWEPCHSTFDYSSVQLAHVVSCKGNFLGAGFVEDATNAPDVALFIVRQIVPDFGACVVRSARLRLKKASALYFRHVEVTDLDSAILVKEYVGSFDVPVDYLHVM
jgi:hypothetical protein